ncbi:MAG: hypothetical protein CML01_16495 [Pseudomonas sp.]|nr:hypothetical protein [Pseudomonas sp.]
MGKQVHDTNHIGQIGISWLRWIIEGKWACGIEVIAAHNDNSIDILILPKRRKNSTYSGPTGDVVFAQVKTGYVRKLPAAGTYKINLGKNHLEEHRQRWLSFPGPTILINVIPPRITGGDPKAYWADLRNPKSFDASGGVIFDLRHKLEGWEGKGELFNLCWRWAELRTLPRIEAPASVTWSSSHPCQLFAGSQSVHKRSRTFYQDWMSASRADPQAFGGIKITNRGWRHMTRIGRSKSRMLQSLLLLPCASKILEPSSEVLPKRLTRSTNSQLPNGNQRERFYEGATARVTFFDRQEAVVRVVLERNIITSPTGGESDDRTLYSIYEVARRRQGI